MCLTQPLRPAILLILLSRSHLTHSLTHPLPSVCLSVRLSHWLSISLPFTLFFSIYPHPLALSPHVFPFPAYSLHPASSPSPSRSPLAHSQRKTNNSRPLWLLMRLCEKESESESGGEVIYIVEGISFNFLFSSPSPSFLLFFLFPFFRSLHFCFYSFLFFGDKCTVRFKSMALPPKVIVMKCAYLWTILL